MIIGDFVKHVHTNLVGVIINVDVQGDFVEIEYWFRPGELATNYGLEVIRVVHDKYSIAHQRQFQVIDEMEFKIKLVNY